MPYRSNSSLCSRFAAVLVACLLRDSSDIWYFVHVLVLSEKGRLRLKLRRSECLITTKDDHSRKEEKLRHWKLPICDCREFIKQKLKTVNTPNSREWVKLKTTEKNIFDPIHLFSSLFAHFPKCDLSPSTQMRVSDGFLQKSCEWVKPAWLTLLEDEHRSLPTANLSLLLRRRLSVWFLLCRSLCAIMNLHCWGRKKYASS